MVKSQPHLDYFQNTHSKMKTSMRLWMYTLNGSVWCLFCLVWSSISWKTLAISNRYIQVVKSQPHLNYFQNTHSKMKTNIRLWMHTLNGSVWCLFCLVWSSISWKTLAISNRYIQVVKSQPHLNYFQNTHSKMKTNIRLWMHTLNGTVWYPFCSVWSSINCFRPENVSYK